MSAVIYVDVVKL